jgi:hypothetical protein
MRIIIIQKDTIWAIESWVCFFMILVSVFFLIFDIMTKGLFFSGSLIALIVTVMFTLLIVRVERRRT